MGSAAWYQDAGRWLSRSLIPCPDVLWPAAPFRRAGIERLAVQIFNEFDSCYGYYATKIKDHGMVQSVGRTGVARQRSALHAISGVRMG